MDPSYGLIAEGVPNPAILRHHHPYRMVAAVTMGRNFLVTLYDNVQPTAPAIRPLPKIPLSQGWALLGMWVG